MDKFICKVTISTQNGVKYYDVLLSPEQIAWLIQNQSVPDMPDHAELVRDGIMKLESLAEFCNNAKQSIEISNDAIKRMYDEVSSGFQSIADKINDVKHAQGQQEAVIPELTGLKQLIGGLAKPDSLQNFADRIQSVVQAQGVLLSNTIATLSNSVDQLKESEVKSLQTIAPANSEQLSMDNVTKMCSTLDNINYNINQLSRQFSAIDIERQNESGDENAVFQRLMYKLVDMPLRLYERTSKRLLFKKETEPSYNTKEMEQVLTFLKRELNGLGIDAISSQMGTKFDPDTMEIDDEHEPICIDGQSSGLVAFSVLPRIIWKQASGMPENMHCREKVILTK